MSNLPYDAEIEYLESTGTQYIDTGIYVNADYSVEAVTKYNSYPSAGWDTMFGTRNGSNSRFTIRDGNNSTTLGFHRSTNKGVAYQSYDYAINRSDRKVWRTYGIYKNVAKIDGVTLYTYNSSTGLDSFEYPLYAFALNSAGTAADFSHLCYKSLKIWDNNDVLVRDYIPVRVGQVGYLYDKVSGELFENSGTGDFILGKDKALPNPFGFRRRLMIVGSNAFSYDSEVEYLQTDGGQYIELPIYVNRGTDALEITYQQTSNTRQCRFLHDGSTTINFYVNGSDKYGLYTTGWANPFNTIIGTYKDIVKIDYKNQMFYVNNIAGSSTGNNTSVSASPLKIFGAYGNNPTAKARLFGFRFWQNEVLEMDCIPVRRNNEGYLYDKIGKQLYGNVGTGSFGIGADTGDISKFTRVDYIQNNSYASIVTDFVPDYNTKVWYDFQINSGEVVTSGWWPVMFGTCNNVNPDRAFILAFPQDNDNYFNFDFGNIKVNTDFNFTNDRLTGYASKDEYTANERSYTMPSVSSFTCPTYMYIFYRPTTTVSYVHPGASSTVIWRGKCFGMKIWENNVLVREYVPVVNQLNVYGLYDTVNNKFFRSNVLDVDFTGGNLT